MKHCAMCRGGSLRPGTISHIVESDNKIIIIKNVPALICGQCGEGYIDHDHALKLEDMAQGARLNGMEVVIINYENAAA